MLHQNLSDHVFHIPYDIDCYVCGVCGFNLSSLMMDEFGISKDDLFFEERDTLDSGVPVNYDVISNTMKQKYIPAFSKQMYDSSALLTEMAGKKMKSDPEDALFRGLEYNKKGERVKKYPEGSWRL